MNVCLSYTRKDLAEINRAIADRRTYYELFSVIRRKERIYEGNSLELLAKKVVDKLYEDCGKRKASPSNKVSLYRSADGELEGPFIEVTRNRVDVFGATSDKDELINLQILIDKEINERLKQC